jgi:asparagine synthase (glutamine-hydrolysing)
MDNSTTADQPFTLELPHGRSVIVVCNGEIYNHHELVAKYQIDRKSRSDCEILPHMYAKLGFDAMVQELHGEFAIALLEINHDASTKIYLARDPLGIRPIFIGQDENGFGFSSIMNGLIEIVEPSSIRQLRGGHIIEVSTNASGDLLHFAEREYFNVANIRQQPDKPLSDVMADIRNSFISAVECRLESDRPMAAMLSGGLDSSLVVAVAARYLRKIGKRLTTISIGMPGATDRKYADIVSKHCNTDHIHIELTNEVHVIIIKKYHNFVIAISGRNKRCGEDN